MAGLVGGLVLLGQAGLAVDGGHAEEGGHPHPENSSRAAGDHGGGTAGDIAGAHLGGDGGGHGLEGAHALLARLLSVEVDAAEQALEAGPELAHLNETGADGENNAGAHQQVEQQTVPHKVCQIADLIGQLVHVHISLLLFLPRTKNGPRMAPRSGRWAKKHAPARVERRAQGRLASSSLSFCLRDWRPVPKTALHLRHPNRRASPESHPRTVLVPGERLRVLLLRQAG